jgi:mRNA interferase HigB
LREFGADHPDAGEPLDRWYRIAKRATWANFAEVRADFGTVDQVGALTVFNIAGNKFRLLAEIFHGHQILLIRGVYTHKDYGELDL